MIKFIKSLFKRKEKINAQIYEEKGVFKLYIDGGIVFSRCEFAV